MSSAQVSDQASGQADAGVCGHGCGPVCGPVLARMRTLSAHPPQSLVIEGGDAQDREAAALAWASLLNCAAGADVRPCGACPACVQIGQGVFQAGFDRLKQVAAGS